MDLMRSCSVLRSSADHPEAFPSPPLDKEEEERDAETGLGSWVRDKVGSLVGCGLG